ncbi:MAG: hypothetical protein ACI4RP_02660 [Acutalibacteraceae bacterium]
MKKIFYCNYNCNDYTYNKKKLVEKIEYYTKRENIKKYSELAYKANVSEKTIRRLLNINKKEDGYKPRLMTLLGICIALKLDVLESEELIGICNYTEEYSKLHFIYKIILKDNQESIVFYNEFLVDYAHKTRTWGLRTLGDGAKI